MNYNEVETCKDLEEYIFNSTERHSKLSQYTSLDSYEKIIKTNSLRLTRINHLNDITELNLVNNNANIFIACFTYSHSEFASMWYMYGRNKHGNKDKVLLEFKNAKFRKCTNFYYYDCSNNQINFKSLCVNFKDVVYIDNKKMEEKKHFLKYHTSSLTKMNYKECMKYYNQNSGMIKYKTWEVEKEVRLLVETDEVPDNIHYIFLNLDDVGVNAKDIIPVSNPWIIKKDVKNIRKSKIYNQIAERSIDSKCENCKIISE